MRECVLPAIALLLVQGRTLAQTTGQVVIAAPFTWPQSEEATSAANRLSKGVIESFVNAARDQIPETKDLPIHVAAFRFVPLERGRLYLVALTGTRFFWSTDVIAPGEHGFRYTELESDGGIPFAMQPADLDGNGVDELVTGIWPTGYAGAGTPSIFWYTVWQFHDGVPEDASARFPEFYRSFVLGQLDYPEALLRRLQEQDPEGTRVPLAEIEYVRFKFQRTILKQTNAGLNEALAWIHSGKSALQVMGIWSLAEMPAPAAGQELTKLATSAVVGDLAKAALARRMQLLGKLQAE